MNMGARLVKHTCVFYKRSHLGKKQSSGTNLHNTGVKKLFMRPWRHNGSEQQGPYLLVWKGFKIGSNFTNN